MDENVGNVTCCVEVCEGILKRVTNFTVDFENGTAFCKFLVTYTIMFRLITIYVFIYNSNYLFF